MNYCTSPTKVVGEESKNAESGNQSNGLAYELPQYGHALFILHRASGALFSLLLSGPGDGNATLNLFTIQQVLPIQVPSLLSSKQLSLSFSNLHNSIHTETNNPPHVLQYNYPPSRPSSLPS